MGRSHGLSFDESTLMDLEVMASSGVALHVAAKRLGYSKPDTMIRAIYRSGEKHLVRRLRMNSHERGVSVQGRSLYQHRDRKGRWLPK